MELVLIENKLWTPIEMQETLVDLILVSYIDQSKEKNGVPSAARCVEELDGFEIEVDSYLVSGSLDYHHSMSDHMSDIDYSDYESNIKEELYGNIFEDVFQILQTNQMSFSLSYCKSDPYLLPVVDVW